MGRWTYALFRVIVVAHVIAIAGQPIWAGLYLSGDYDMVGVHFMGANILWSLGIAQLIVAPFVWWRAGARWPTPVSAVLAGAEYLQFAVGVQGVLALHIPLGVGIAVAGILTLVGVLRPRRQEVAR